MSNNTNVAGWWVPDWDTALEIKPFPAYPYLRSYFKFVACASYVAGYAEGYSEAKKHLGLPHYFLTDKSGDDFSVDFDKFKEEWLNDTAIISNPNQIAMHPAYQRIIGMGEKAIPLIIREMINNPGHWFWALKAITGEDPVPEEARGNIRRMTDLWLDWWEDNKESYE